MGAKVLTVLMSLMLFLSASNVVFAADPTVLRVVVVETQNVDGYLQELERGRALLKRLGSQGTMRVWRAKFAGPNAGVVAVAIEFPSIAALAAEDAKTAGDAEFQTWLKGLDKVRKIKSDSLYQELGP